MAGQALESRTLGPLPLLLQISRAIRLAEIIDEMVSWDRTRSRLSPGQRIEALAYVIVMACLVFSAFARRVRAALAAAKRKIFLPGKRWSERPTGKMLLDLVAGLAIARIGSGPWMISSPRAWPRGQRRSCDSAVSTSTPSTPAPHHHKIGPLRPHVRKTGYKSRGFAGLLPEERSDRGIRRILPEQVVTRAIALRQEDPERSVLQIIRLIELEGLAEQGQTKRTTLSEVLCRAGVSRAEVTRHKQAFQLRESPYPNAMWQIDTCQILYLPDAQGRRRTIHLVATLDDYSRHVIARLYPADDRPALADLLKRAIVARGKPEQLYSDNGSAYRSTAWAISHTRNTYLGATFWRLAGHIGKKKAVLAIARKTVVAIHCMLSEHVTYAELGADYRRRVDAERYERKLLERVKALGYEVIRRTEPADGKAV